MALIAGCLVASPSVAAATVTVSATPTTGLTDGQFISVTVSGQSSPGIIGECGNAYADGTPLPQFGQRMATDCSFPPTPGPWILIGNGTGSFRVRETGIGTGNRSCVIVAPNPCYLWGIGPPILISFAQDITGTTYDTTATAAAPSLSVAVGHSFGIRAHVAINGNYVPDGTIEVSDGSNVVGTGQLSSGEAVATIPGLAVGVHQFDVHYDGNGSFAPFRCADAGKRDRHRNQQHQYRRHLNVRIHLGCRFSRLYCSAQ